jgi:hypothetical protein
MTVLAFDGKVFAADRQSQSGDLISRVCKIRRLPNGDVIAWSGAIENGLAMAQWYEAGADPSLFPASQKMDDWSRLVVVPKKGRPFVFEQLPVRQMILDSRWAFGSGRDVAMGALEMGADAVRAVKIASKLCSSCGLGVQSFRVR